VIILRQNLSQFKLQVDVILKSIYEINKFTARYFHLNLKKYDNVRKYLSDRGISEQMIKKFAVGYIGQGDELIDALQKKKISMKELVVNTESAHKYVKKVLFSV